MYDERGKARSQFTITQAQTKGDSARTIYVSKKLMRILDAYHALVAGRAASAPLFITQIHTRFSANTMCQLFLQIYKDCGLKGATSHSGRRTYITKLANAGINVRLLAELAGHKHHSTLYRCKRQTVSTRCGTAVMGNKRVLALRKQLKREQ
ncbi:MAG: tyrosine-type recombinase/integrase, partial [Planktomarina sp.]|nr:tyrosine-type recombinase/integrase [Planktomarina sp.]